MTSDSIAPPDPLTRRGWLLVACYLAVLVWVARFWYCRDFGLCEDDCWIFSPFLDGNLPHALAACRQLITGFFQGRPLANVVATLLACLAGQLHSLFPLYLAAYGAVLTNAVLMCVFLNRYTGTWRTAVLGATLFVLLPTDNTQAYLTHGILLQPALGFVLAALTLYLYDRPRLAYVALSLSLVTYEAWFFVFLAAPLLLPARDRLSARLVRNALTMAAIFLVYFLIRRLLGHDSRASSLGPHVLFIAIRNSIVRPAHFAAWLVVFVPYIYLLYWHKLLLLWAVVLLPLGWLGVRRLQRDAEAPLQPFAFQLGRLRLSGIWAGDLRRWLGWIGVGILLLWLGYWLSLSHLPRFILAGRPTRAHTGAAIGWVIVLLGVIAILRSLAREYRATWVFTALLAAWLTAMIVHDLGVQLDCRDAYRDQHRVWQQIAALCPDLDDGVVILLDLHGRPTHTAIDNYIFDTTFILPGLYRFPADYREPPIVARLAEGWMYNLPLDGQTLTVAPPWVQTVPDLRRQVPLDKVILIAYEDGKLVRHDHLTQAGNLAIRPLPAAGTPPLAFPHNLLYNLYLGHGQGLNPVPR